METNHNRVKLNGKDSIPAVINGMTLEEKVSMLSAVSACMTKAIPELDIPMIRLYDGVTRQKWMLCWMRCTRNWRKLIE